MARPNQGSNGLIWFPPASAKGLAADPYSDKLVLALPFNQECGLANQAGVGSVGRTDAIVTGMKGVTISQAQSRFYGASAYFSGSGQHYLEFHGESLEFRTQDFTIEAWIYPTALGNSSNGYYRRFLATAVNGTDAIQIVTDGGSNLGYSPSASSGAYGAPSLNQWSHIAATRQSGTVRFFLNGVLAGSYSDSADKNAVRNKQLGKILIGLYPDLTGGEFSGYVNDLKVYKGVAKYTAAFNPPGACYSTGASNVSGGIVFPSAVPATSQSSASAIGYGGKVHDVIYLGEKYRVHQFDSIGTSTFEVAAAGNFEVLVVAGGGGGGQWYAGGGGAGGVIHHPSLALSAGNYSLTVGNGGIGQPPGAPIESYPSNSGRDGEDSSFGSIIVAKGGGGGPGYNAPSNGRSGGSGSGGRSGGGSGGTAIAGTVPSGATHYGYNGGVYGGTYSAGGGGGSGGQGGNGSGNTGGAGGPGRVFEITGQPYYYAAGGGGAGYGVSERGAPGLGGGGRGGHFSRGYDGATFGSGGGGVQGDSSSHNTYAGGSGRQGVIIVRYRI